MTKPDIRLEEVAAELQASTKDVLRLIQWHGFRADAPAVTEERVDAKSPEPDRISKGTHWSIKPVDLLALSWGQEAGFEGISEMSGMHIRVTYIADRYTEALVSAEQFEEMRGTWEAWRSGDLRVASLASAESSCKDWLKEQMSAAPSTPKPKDTMYREARERFVGLSHRGFLRAWKAAVESTGASAWSSGGRRSAK